MTSPLLFRFYEHPTFSCCVPNKVSFSGAEQIAITGSGFFPSEDIRVKLKASWTEKIVKAIYINDSMLMFDAPTTSYSDDYRSDNFSVNVYLAMDGINYVKTSHSLSDFSYELRLLLKVGFLFHGLISDLGWSYSLNQGRKEIEILYPSLLTEYTEGSPEKIKDLVLDYCKRNFSIVFAGSFSMMDDSREASTMPECKKTHVVTATALHFEGDVMSAMFARVFQAKYLAGMTAGYMMKKKFPHSTCVGYIGGEIIPEVFRGFNAFALGCRRANPNCIVKVVFLNLWNAPKLAKEAAKYMWYHEGCRVIAQETDSAAPSIVFNELGGYSIGYNSDMSAIVGSSVLTSPYVRWGKLYSHFIDPMMKLGHGSFTGGLDIFPGIMDDAVSLWPFSNEVDFATRTKILDVWKKFQKGEDDAFCGDLMKRTEQQNRVEPVDKFQNCLNRSSLNQMNYRIDGAEFSKVGTTPYGAIKHFKNPWEQDLANRPLFYFPEHDWELPFAAMLVCLLITSLGILAVSYTFYFMFKNQNNIWFKSHSVRLMWFILVSCLLMFFLPIFLSMKPTLFSCSMIRFVTHLSFIVCAPPICLKTYRLHKFFSAARNYRTSRCSDKQLLTVMCVSLVFYLWYAIFWAMSHPAVATRKYIERNKFYVTSCRLPDVWDFAIFIPECAILICAIYLVCVIRGIPKRFNESKYIAFTLYTVLVVGIIIITLVQIIGEDEPLLVYILSNFGILVIAWVTFGSLFGVKINKIWKNEKLNLQKSTYDRQSKDIQMNQIKRAEG